MRRVLLAVYRAARSVVEEWLRGPLPIDDLPEPDPAALGRLSPGLRRIVDDARIVRAALLGEVEVIDASWEARSLYKQRYERPRDERDTPEYAAQLASVRAGALLFEFVSQVRGLPMVDRDLLERYGFGTARMDALIGLVASSVLDDAPLPEDRPTSVPFRRAANELTALERALLHAPERTPYR